LIGKQSHDLSLAMATANLRREAIKNSPAKAVRHEPALWFDVIAWSILPTAMNLPMLLDPNGSKSLAIVVFITILAKNLLLLPATSYALAKEIYGGKVSEAIGKKSLTAVSLLALCLFFCIWRGLGESYTLSNTVSTSALFVLCPLALISSLLVAKTPAGINKIAIAFLLAAPLFVAANLILFAAGLRGVSPMIEDNSNQLLGLLGVNFGRVVFPMAFGKNGMGALAGASFVVAMLLGNLSASKAGKGFFFALAASSLAVMVMTDSRGSFMYALMTLAILFSIHRDHNRSRLLKRSIFLIPLVPVFAVWLFDFANKSGAFEFLVRPGSKGASLGVGTGRNVIWSAILERIADVEAIQFIGYGAFGQITSKVSAGYAWIFDELGGTSNSAHNAFFQYILDVGYLGAAIYLALLYVTFDALEKKIIAGKDLGMKDITVMAVCIYGLFQSQTEAYGTIYTPESLLILLGAGLLAGTNDDRNI
jgi:hypothetical protein